MLKRLEAVHRVARADTHDTLVGLDSHDRRGERTARNGIPGGVERRGERLHETIEPDGGDLHATVWPGDGNTAPVSPNLRRGVTSGHRLRYGFGYRQTTLRSRDRWPARPPTVPSLSSTMSRSPTTLPRGRTDGSQAPST